LEYTIKIKEKGRDPNQREEWNRHHKEVYKLLIELRSGLTTDDLEKKTGLSRPTIYKHLRALREEGYEIDKSGRMGEWRYLPTPESVSKLPSEIKAMTQKGTSPGKGQFLHAHRSYRPSTTKNEIIGSVVLFTEPPMPTNKLWEIAYPHADEFLSDNSCWLRDIFRCALNLGLINKKYFSGKKNIDKISNKELNQIWRALFSSTKFFVGVLSINPTNLLEWLKTEQGKTNLKQILSDKVLKNIYSEFLKEW